MASGFMPVPGSWFSPSLCWSTHIAMHPGCRWIAHLESPPLHPFPTRTLLFLQDSLTFQHTLRCFLPTPALVSVPLPHSKSSTLLFDATLLCVVHSYFINTLMSFKSSACEGWNQDICSVSPRLLHVVDPLRDLLTDWPKEPWYYRV